MCVSFSDEKNINEYGSKKMHKKVLNNPICSYCIIDLKKEDTEQKKLQGICVCVYKRVAK